MRTSDTLLLALRMFRTRPMRTLLTILGVGVGIGTVFFLVSIGYGLQQTILNRIANADTLLTLDVMPPSDAVLLDDESVSSIASIESVEQVAKLASFSAQIGVGTLTSDMELEGMDPSFFRFSGSAPAAGTFFTADDQSGAVLSSAAAKLFGEDPEQVIGKHVDFIVYLPTETEDGRVTIREWSGSTIVRGVLTDEDKSRVILPLNTLGPLSIDHYDQLKVKVDGQSSMTGVRDSIIATGFVVASLSDVIDQAAKIFKIIQIVLGFFGLVALVVSAIGMFNTMTIALLERTNEIGIMRSIGMTRRNIMVMFLVESMAMGFLGGIGGLVLGAGIGEAVNYGLNSLAQRFNGPPVDIFLAPLWFVAVIMIFSTSIGFLTGLYPSFRAARLNPLDALRYK
ncbi:MAG: ABC transporter permease [Candidatus Peribacteraceae bacterium]|nr:ABC transporter permease [Candidatus Peribacteraceae bacterium]